jgi:uncharacterized membrane protein (UPF0127 family)
MWIVGGMGIVLLVAFWSVFRFDKSTLVFPESDTVVVVSVANTDETRRQGLSGQEFLRDDTGMLFDFERDIIPGMWMKDMRFSLDFLWIDSNFRIVEIAENISPKTFPEVFRPKEPVRYVLEVPAGFVAKHGISVGEWVDFRVK